MANHKTYDLPGGALSNAANANFAARLQAQGASSTNDDYYLDLPGFGYTIVSTSAPSAAPPFAGCYYFHTTGKVLYFATGTASVNDWQQFTLGGTTISGLDEETNPTIAGLALLLSNDKKYSLNKLTTRVAPFITNGGGSVITAGNKGTLRLEFPGTIVRSTVIGDQTGTIQFDIKKSNLAGVGSGTSICGSAFPALSSERTSEDATLTGWTTTFAKGDVLEYEVASSPAPASVTSVTLSLEIVQTGA